jgi:superfamily II helicase
MSMTEIEYRRRSAVLASANFDPLTTVAKLRSELEMVHGIACSADLIRADLSWLQEMGLVRFDGNAAQCTERGKDVAQLRAKFPGWV